MLAWHDATATDGRGQWLGMKQRTHLFAALMSML